MNGTQYDLITRAEDIPALVESLERQPAVGIDTETTGLDPYTSKLRLLQFSVPGRNVLLDLFELHPESLKPVFALLENPKVVKVAHNAKFDAKFLRCTFGVTLNGIFDTYLTSVLVGAGSEIDRHSLEASVQRFLSITMNKEAQLSD
jgi:DNA polymerase-1